MNKILVLRNKRVCFQGVVHSFGLAASMTKILVLLFLTFSSKMVIGPPTLKKTPISRVNRRFFFKVSGPMTKILVLRSKRVLEGLVMLWRNNSKAVMLQVGLAFDWPNFKTAKETHVCMFDSAHQKFKTKELE